MLVIEGLTIKKDSSGAPDHLVEDVHLRLRMGRPLTLIGESGCGKTLVGRAVMGMIPKGMQAKGRILFSGTDLLSCQVRTRRRLWGRELFLFPQEPGRYLNPLMRALPQVTEVSRLKVFAYIYPQAQYVGATCGKFVSTGPIPCNIGFSGCLGNRDSILDGSKIP